ncbi:MAG: tetratricopeptide repeat protein [bacterium]
MSKYLLIVFITLFMTAGNDSSASEQSFRSSFYDREAKKHAAQSSKSAPAGDRFRSSFYDREARKHAEQSKKPAATSDRFRSSFYDREAKKNTARPQKPATPPNTYVPDRAKPIEVTPGINPGTLESPNSQANSGNSDTSANRRTGYTEFYRDTYQSGDYARQYRENYRTNPLYTGRGDNYWGNRWGRIGWRMRGTPPRGYSYPPSAGVPLRDARREQTDPLSDPTGRLPIPEAGAAQSEAERTLTPGAPATGIYPPMFSPAMLRMYYQRKQQQAQQERAAAQPQVASPTSERQIRSDAPRVGDEALIPPQSELHRELGVQKEQPAGDQSVQLRSPSEHIFNNGLIALESSRYTQAKETFESLLAISPNDEEVQMAYGVTLFFSGDYHNAANALQKSSSLANRNLSSTSELEQWITNLNMYDFHLQRLKQHVIEHPDDVDASTLLLLLPSVNNA